MKKKFILFCLFITLPLTLISCKISKDEIVQGAPLVNEKTNTGLKEQPKEDLFESNISRPYTKEESIKNNDLVYDEDQDKYVDSKTLKAFLDKVRKNEPAKIRYTQYFQGILDKMRDVEFDGVTFTLKEYDTKSPDVKYYRYIIDKGESITIVSSYYKLDGDNLKLFPVE